VKAPGCWPRCWHAGRQRPLRGLEAAEWTVEVGHRPGLPGLQVVGLPIPPGRMPRAGQGRLAQTSGFRVPLTRADRPSAWRQRKAAQGRPPSTCRMRGSACCWPVASWRPERLDGVWSCRRKLGLDRSLRAGCAGVIALALRHGAGGARALVVPAANGFPKRCWSRVI